MRAWALAGAFGFGYFTVASRFIWGWRLPTYLLLAATVLSVAAFLWALYAKLH